MRNPEIDSILKEMAAIYTNIGIDSTEQEKQDAKQLELQMIGKISEIDPEMGLRLLANDFWSHTDSHRAGEDTFPQ